MNKKQKDDLLQAVLSFISFTSGLLGWTTVVYFSYQWFILPLFSFLPEILFWQALGIRLFSLSLQRVNLSEMKDEYYKESKVTRTTQGIFVPWIVLGINFLVWLAIR